MGLPCTVILGHLNEIADAQAAKALSESDPYMQIFTPLLRFPPL